ncbi:MAG: hypothetical protein IT582_07655 [Opitutaceae bacterium]|nr:hypothetical protein [Opitutaceae bacterium]
MKNSSLNTLFAAATLFLAPTLLSAQPAPDKDTPPPREPRWARFDANQDGKLDDTERTAAKQALRDNLSKNPRFLERADTDKDGAISDSEWAAAQKKMKSMRQHRMEKRGKMHRAQAAKHHRGALLKRFDANQDGKLDETERAAARAEGEKRVRAHLEKQLARLKAADADGDGKLRASEWATAKEKFREKRAERRGGPEQMPPPPEE